MSKIAEVTLELSCGGKLTTYIKCKGEKDLLKKLKNRNKKGWINFGHIKVEDAYVFSAVYEMHEAH